MDSFTDCPHDPKVTIEDEGRWIEKSETDIENMFGGLQDYLKDNEIDNIDWSRLNFGVYDEQYYRDKFGEGFPDEWYRIMAKATEEDNKIQDHRMPSLSIDQKPTTISFD